MSGSQKRYVHAYIYMSYVLDVRPCSCTPYWPYFGGPTFPLYLWILYFRRVRLSFFSHSLFSQCLRMESMTQSIMMMMMMMMMMNDDDDATLSQ